MADRLVSFLSSENANIKDKSSQINRVSDGFNPHFDDDCQTILAEENLRQISRQKLITRQKLFIRAK